MADTIQCPHCGATNDSGFAMCKQCLTPLTAYSGQLTGESYQGKLAQKVSALNTRPVPVAVMTVFDVLLAVFVPVSVFMRSLPKPVSTNPDDMYQAHMSTAFSSITAVMVGLVMIPLAVAILWLAWATFTQRTWSWNANFAPVAVFVIMMLTHFSSHSAGDKIVGSGGLLFTVVLLFFWYRTPTREWYGL